MRTSGPQKPKSYVLLVDGEVVAYGSNAHVNERARGFLTAHGEEQKHDVKIQPAPDYDTPGMGGHG